MLFRRRKHLDDPDNIIKYGLFYIGLTDKAYYWEILIINLRKILFVGISVSLSGEKTRNFQALLCFSIIYVNLHLTKAFRPYHNAMLNNMDIYSSTASMATILLGIFFLEPETHENEWFLFMLFVLLVISNSLFLIYWAIRMLIVMFGKMKRGIDKIKTMMGG